VGCTVQARASSGEESFFPMEMEGAPQGDDQEIPFGAGNLDFGSRDGGGVVGPKLAATLSRQADKFEVKEGNCPRWSALFGADEADDVYKLPEKMCGYQLSH